MTKWDYGDEGRAFPVAVGQTWKCGEHLFHCSDLMASTTFDDLLVANPPDLLYSDPPWGQSLANSFRTKAGLEKAEYRWTNLYERIAAIGHAFEIPIWVECSTIEHRDGQHVPLTLAAESHPYRGYVQLVYYRKHPMGLFYAGAEPANDVLLDSMRGVDDDFTPGIVMASYAESGVVIDPCSGRGVTSRQAQEKGWRSVNNELNPNRVSAALTRMAKMIDAEPERVA